MVNRRQSAVWLLGICLFISGCQSGLPAASVDSAQPVERAPATTAPVPETPLADAAEAVAPTEDSPAAGIPAPSRWSYTVVDELPHDIRAFTQGLVYADDIFYEGTGLRGQSTLRKVDPATGEVLAGVRYPDQYFAEGVAVLGDRIFQLTWQSNVGFIFDKETLASLGEFSYPTEGWGLTYDGERLIMSDGTSTVYFLDPETQAMIGQISVQDDQGPVVRLNELEYIDGQIYANIWQTEQIAVIDPATGFVTAYIDLAGLPDEAARRDLMETYDLADEAALAGFLRSNATLNGIAYDVASDRLFVTGKLWPEIYQIELVAD